MATNETQGPEYHTVTDLGQDGVLCLCSLAGPHTEEEAYASGAWEDDRP